MNKNQKNVAMVAACIIGLMLLFPPFYSDFGGMKSSNGYSFILSGIGSIDILQLLVQWIGVVIVGGVFLVVFKDRSDS